MEDLQFKNDVARIRTYMYQNHCGYKHAAPRRDIAKVLGMEDRYFRATCSSIDELMTSSRLNYYILPLVDITGEETRMAKQIVEGEERRRMIALYLRQRRQRQAIRRMSGDKQMAFA